MHLTLNEVSTFLQTASVDSADKFIRNKFPMIFSDDLNDHSIKSNIPILQEMINYIFYDGQCDELDMVEGIASFFKYKNINELTY